MLPSLHIQLEMFSDLQKFKILQKAFEYIVNNSDSWLICQLIPHTYGSRISKKLTGS
jgi:hypothetical protein